MQKLITFRKLKDICWLEDQNPSGSYCNHENHYGTTYTDYVDGLLVKCCAKSCPIWRGLKEAK